MGLTSILKKIGIALVIIIGLSYVTSLLFFQNYSIPTPAMEGTLLVGDHIAAAVRPSSQPLRGDIVVFHVPSKVLNENRDLPIGSKTPYIKRCIALPGEMLKISDKDVYVNNVKIPDPPKTQYSYIVTTKGPISDRFLNKYDLTPNEDFLEQPMNADGSRVYSMFLTRETADELGQSSFVESIEVEKRDRPDGTFPYSSFNEWS